MLVREIYVGENPTYAYWHGLPLQRCVVLKWFYSLSRRNTFVGGTRAPPSALLVFLYCQKLAHLITQWLLDSKGIGFVLAVCHKGRVAIIAVCVICSLCLSVSRITHVRSVCEPDNSRVHLRMSPKHGRHGHRLTLWKCLNCDVDPNLMWIPDHFSLSWKRKVIWNPDVDSRSLFCFALHCGMWNFKRFLSVSHSHRLIFMKLGDMTDADKRMNWQHFMIDCCELMVLQCTVHCTNGQLDTWCS